MWWDSWQYKDIIECLEIVKTLLATVNENLNRINEESYFKNFEEKFNMYKKTYKDWKESKIYFNINHFI